MRILLLYHLIIRNIIRSINYFIFYFLINQIRHYNHKSEEIQPEKKKLFKLNYKQLKYLKFIFSFFITIN